MQQWEDWRPGYDGRVLVEKTVLTLLVVSFSYFVWLRWASARREAAVPYRVPLPPQLKHSPQSGPDEQTAGGGPTEEVRDHSSRYTNADHDIGLQWQNLPPRSRRRPTSPG